MSQVGARHSRQQGVFISDEAWQRRDPESLSYGDDLSTAMRNGTLQGAYLIVAARALGLDCGPMSSFDNAGVDKAFFAGTPIRSNFICSIGHGDPASVFPRNARLNFEEAGRLA